MTQENENNGIKCTNNYNFNNGVEVEQSRIKEYHKDILEHFEKDKNCDYHHVRAGKAMVLGKRNKETGVINIFEVTNGYEYFQYEPK